MITERDLNDYKKSDCELFFCDVADFDKLISDLDGYMSVIIHDEVSNNHRITMYNGSVIVGVSGDKV